MRTAVKIGERMTDEPPRFGLVSGPLPRPVRRIKVQAQQEGLSSIGVTVDHIDGVAAENISQVANLLDLDAEWAACNAAMLPEIASYTDNFTGADLADHIGTPETSHKADNHPAVAAPHR